MQAQTHPTLKNTVPFFQPEFTSDGFLIFMDGARDEEAYLGSIDVGDMRAGEDEVFHAILAKAKLRWPEHADNLCLQDAMWTAYHQAKMEVEILRNPWPYAYYQAGCVATACNFEWTVTETCLRPRIHSFHGFFESCSFSYGTTSLHESEDTAADERAASEKYAMYLLAGSVAEFRFDSGRTERNNDFNSLEARFAVAGYADGCEEKYLEWLKARVVRLINHNWPSIELVAAALIERRRLTGHEIDMVLAQSSRRAVHRPFTDSVVGVA